MRAATRGERVTDTARDAFAALASQPLAELLDALGLTNVEGWDARFADPAAAPAVEDMVSPLIGMAKGPTKMPKRVNAASDTRHAELLRKLGGTRGTTPAPAPRAPIIGKAGARIERDSQAGVGTEVQNMGKIPRFRSPLGTFVKHEGEWWRIKPGPADALDVTLELLPPGVPESGTVPRILQSKTISADDLVSGIRKAKGVTEPVRNKSTKPRF